LCGPEDDLREGCLRAYADEKARGTEFIAILGYLEQWMADAGAELYEKRREQNQQRIAREKAASEVRLRSGADCPWTEVKSVTTGIHCRKNGRLYRLVKVEKGMVEVSQVTALDDKRGVYIGRYFSRSEATKVLNEVAYKPEWNG
jgi:hypothetical protein